MPEEQHSGLADLDNRVSQMAERQERRDTARARERMAQAFDFVENPPRRLRRGEIPEVRRAAVEACKAHPGQWLHYHPDPADDPVEPLGLTNGIRRGTRGFEEGKWEVRTAKGQLYFRFVQ